jgi:dihydroxyacetone kinase-like protein
MSSGEHIGLAIFRQIQETIAEHAEELTTLDRAIGDGDHGTNLTRGFNAALQKVEMLEDQALANVIKTAAMTLISTVGGAAGPLYGTALLRFSTTLQGKESKDPNALVAAFAAAIEGVKQRGKSTTGEKTMLDALVPAYEALQSAIRAGATIPSAFVQAAAAAKAGAEATIPMLATKGRASYLGERSIGHQDPGATSSWYILQAVADTLVAREATQA